MMKYKLLGLLCGMLLFAGCFHEDDLKPLGVEEPFLSLPQGDNDYDDRIMQLFTDYGVSIFYKFEPKDVYFNYTGGNWLEAVPETYVAPAQRYPYIKDPITDAMFFTFNDTRDSVLLWNGDTLDVNFEGAFEIGERDEEGELWQSVVVNYLSDGTPTSCVIQQEMYRVAVNSFTVECADTNYVNKQLDLLQGMLLDYYSPEMLKTGMPSTMMLGKNLQVVDDEQGVVSEAYLTANNNFILNYGNEAIDTLKLEDYRELKNGLNTWFLVEGMLDTLHARMKVETDYFTYSDYTTNTSYRMNNKNGQKYYMSLGYCVFGLDARQQASFALATTTEEDREKMDLQMMLSAAIQFPYEYLTEDVAATSFGLSSYDLNDPKGRLGATQDTQGLTFKKYHILVDYMNNQGIDLMAMGRAYQEETAGE